jgi:hypothetical protein
MFIGSFRRLLVTGRRVWQQKNRFLFNLATTTHKICWKASPVVSSAIISTVIVPFTPKFDDMVYYIRTKNVDAFKLALSTGNINLGANNNQLIIEACNAGHVEIVKLLLNDPKVDPSAHFNKALFDVCESSGADLEIIDMLIKHPKVNPSIGKVIYAAARNSDWHVIDLILRHPKADPSIDDNEAIIEASKVAYCDSVVIRLMEDPRVNPSARNNEAFMSAIWNGHYITAIVLLRDPRVDPFVSENAGVNIGEAAIKILEQRSTSHSGLLKDLYKRRQKIKMDSHHHSD